MKGKVMTNSVHTKLPLMPKATAIWLVENTSLTFIQISEFCGLHELEIRAIADGESLQGMMGISPITMGQLTMEEIERCQKDASAHLHLQEAVTDELFKRKAKKQDLKVGGKYTPRARRGERPDAIAWLIKNYPTLTDAYIIKLIGTTKSTIEAIRTRTHWNMVNIKPRSPVTLGFCSQEELEKTVEASQKPEAEVKEKPATKPKKVKAPKVKKDKPTKKTPVKKKAAPKKEASKPKKQKSKK